MDANQWISLAAVGVAGLTIVISGFVSPRINARRERSHRIGDKRSEVYTDALVVLRARYQETVYAATDGVAEATAGEPTEAELARILAQVILYAP